MLLNKENVFRSLDHHWRYQHRRHGIRGGRGSGFPAAIRQHRAASGGPRYRYLGHSGQQTKSHLRKRKFCDVVNPFQHKMNVWFEISSRMAALFFSKKVTSQPTTASMTFTLESPVEHRWTTTILISFWWTTARKISLVWKFDSGPFWSSTSPKSCRPESARNRVSENFCLSLLAIR